MIWDILVRWPLRMLYFHGPSSWGMWQGEGTSDICSRLTGVESVFWEQHREDCENLVLKKFNAFMVSIQTILYVFLSYKILSFLCWRYMVYLPLVRVLQDYPFHLLPQSKQV
jgi:hypothetical protein